MVVSALLVLVSAFTIIARWTWATYPGGDEALNKYIQDSMRYPEQEKSIGYEAIVEVKFDISKEGKTINVQAEQIFGKSPAFKAEAIRLVQAMPKWNPATKNGRPIIDKGNHLQINFFLPDSLAYMPPPIQRYNGI